MPMPVISAYDFADFSDDTDIDNSPLKVFLRDKVVFLTGGTGALGEVYIEKLLRSNVKRLYLLVRETPGKSADDRITAICDTALFSKLKKSHPRFIQRIRAVAGNLAELGLGLSAADRAELCDNVQLIIHAGGNVRFDSTFGEVAMVNVRGTRETLRLAHNMKGLLGFAYISTAFSHCHLDRIEEKFYEAPIDPDQAVRMAEHFGADSEVLQVLSETMTKPWPNAFVFSKAITEELVRRASNVVPVTVIRPSIVLATHEDPLPGYNTNTNDINGIMVAGSVGFMRVVSAQATSRAHICCSDFVVSATLAALHNLHIEKYADQSRKTKVAAAPKIYTVTLNSDELRWGPIKDSVISNALDNPILQSVWLPRMYLMACLGQVKLFALLYELIPNLLMDTFFSLASHKVRFMPMYRRAKLNREHSRHFMRRDWDMVCENVLNLYDGLHKSDRSFYPCDLPNFDWSDFSYKYALGIKRFAFKENLNNIEEARTKQRKLRIAHVFVLFFYYAALAVFYYAVLRLSGITGRVSNVLNAVI